MASPAMAKTEVSLITTYKFNVILGTVGQFKFESEKDV